MSQFLNITVSDLVARVTLARPDVRNAFNDELIAELTEAFTALGTREDVRCIVLAAQGKAFCAGADLNWMRRMADYSRDENIADSGKLAEMLHVLYTCPSPPSRACRAMSMPAAPAWWRPATWPSPATRRATACPR